MADVLKITNSYDGTFITVDTGKTVTLNVGKGAMLIVEYLLDIPGANIGDVVFANTGGITVGTTHGGPGSGGTNMHFIAPCSVQPPQEGDGNVLHAGLTIMAGTLGYATVGFILHYHAAEISLGDPPPALPADVSDVQVDLLHRTVSSVALALTPGFKAGDDIRLAVIPRRDGVFVAANISALKLAIRPLGQFTGAPLVLDADAVDPEGIDPNQYYLVAFQLDSAVLTRWFADANFAAAGGATTPDPTKLLVGAELRFTETVDAESTVTTSDTFTFPVLQSIVAPAP